MPMFLSFLPELISGASSLVGGLIGNIFNYNQTKQTNQANRDINQQNLDFQAQQTQAAWERDDTAHQREVADLQAAGLSPLANTSGNNVTAPLGAPNPIGMQAPQIDVSQLMNTALGYAKLTEEKRSNLKAEEYKEDEIFQRSQELSYMAEQLALDNKKINETIRYQTRVNELEAQRLQEVERANKEVESIRNKELTESERSNKANEKLKAAEQTLQEFSEDSQYYYEEINKMLGGRDMPYHVYNDFNEYQNALADYQAKEKEALSKLQANYSATSKARGGNGSIDLGLNAPAFTGAKAGGSAGFNKQDSQAQSIQQKQDYEMESFYRSNEYPIYGYDLDYRVRNRKRFKGAQ